jgi:hypothetical protein
MVHSILVGLAVIVWCVFAAASRRGRRGPRAGEMYRGTLGSESIDLHPNTGHHHGHDYSGGQHGVVSG